MCGAGFDTKIFQVRIQLLAKSADSRCVRLFDSIARWQSAGGRRRARCFRSRAWRAAGESLIGRLQLLLRFIELALHLHNLLFHFLPAIAATR